MSNDYNDKSWTDRTNWILTVIALALVAILSIGLLCALFIRPQEKEEEALPKDGAIISETAENGISLMSAKIMPAVYAANGVSALADTAYTLTATVEPNYEGEKTFDWSVKFQNASSSWAKGKTVTDYVTVTPTSDGANTATVVYTVSATATYSDVYTLAESATCKVAFLTSAGANDSHTYFNNHGSSGSMGSYSATYVDEVENAIGKTFSFDNHMFEPYNFRHESGSFVSGEMTKNTTYYKDLSGEELAERYLMTDKDTVLWRVAASVEGKYGSFTREDSYLMYSWPAAGNYANLSLSADSLIF